jgi:hypothetical protein
MALDEPSFQIRKQVSLIATCTTTHKIVARHDLEDRLRGGVVIDVTTAVADASSISGQYIHGYIMDVYKYLTVGYISVFRVYKENITMRSSRCSQYVHTK